MQKFFLFNIFLRVLVFVIFRELEVFSIWVILFDIIRFKNYNCFELIIVFEGDLDGIDYVENVKVSESLLLMKFYFLFAGIVGYLLFDVDGRALDLLFEVMDQEKQIILYNKSSFILG